MKLIRRIAGILLLAMLYALPAMALEISAPASVRPFDDIVIRVQSGQAGKLTIQAFHGGMKMKSPVPETEIPAGTSEFPWDALNFGGEPVPPGPVTLKGILKLEDGSTAEAEFTANAVMPRTAVVACLPSARMFCADGRHVLKIECAMSAAGTCRLFLAPKDDPENILWRTTMECDGREPVAFSWNGRVGGKCCPPGEYVFTATTFPREMYTQTAEVTVVSEMEPLEIGLTGGLIPEDLSDDEAVWKALTAPVVVGNGPEGKGLYISDKVDGRYVKGWSVSCRTVGVDVLELCDDGWVKIGAWVQQGGYYREGYVKKDMLQVIRPNTSYGAVLDKKAQTMTVYADGHPIGTMAVSTGYTDGENRRADTHSGVYLLGTRMKDFRREGFVYRYPIRIDGPNLIHSVGYQEHNRVKDYSEQIATLGQNVSHGCVRMDIRGEINAWWVWTHMGKDCKIIITPGT